MDEDEEGWVDALPDEDHYRDPCPECEAKTKSFMDGSVRCIACNKLLYEMRSVPGPSQAQYRFHAIQRKEQPEPVAEPVEDIVDAIVAAKIARLLRRIEDKQAVVEAVSESHARILEALGRIVGAFDALVPGVTPDGIGELYAEVRKARVLLGGDEG